MSRPPTVFVVQESTDKDFSPALEYGQVECLLPEGKRVMFMMQPVIEELRFKLSKFDPDQDCLLATGDPIAIGIATHLAALRAGYVNLLKWDHREHRYYKLLADFRVKT